MSEYTLEPNPDAADDKDIPQSARSPKHYAELERNQRYVAFIGIAPIAEAFIGITPIAEAAAGKGWKSPE